MDSNETRWVARLTATPGVAMDDLLRMPLGLDVWERHADQIVVAATSSQLSEIERRRLVSVDRISTVDDYLSKHE